MPRQYLFGPVSATFAEQHLGHPRQACKVFDCAPGVDLVVRPEDNWETLLQRLPGDWRPEFLVLYLQYRTIPPWLFQAPVPVIALSAARKEKSKWCRCPRPGCGRRNASWRS